MKDSAIDDRFALPFVEGCRRLGISVRHGRNLARRGQIPILKLGAKLLIPRPWIDERLEAAIAEARETAHQGGHVSTEER